MLIDQSTVQAGLRVADGKRVYYLSPGDCLTNAAKDWLHEQRVEVVCRPQTPPAQFRTLSGAVLTEKPESMTHLAGNILVAKDHPRIVFRGMIDTLEAEILLAQKAAQAEQNSALVAQLQQVLEFVRNLIPCDVLGKPVGEFSLCGLDAAALREHSHHPERYYGQHHFMPAVTDSRSLLWLNRVRTVVRQTEIACYRAFSTPDGEVQREDMVLALNRLSSLIWILMIQQKAARKGE